jgi:hypothetical protein
MVACAHRDDEAAHMFGRHRTTPDPDIAAALHERLASGLVAARTEPSRIDPLGLRVRLVAAGGPGLRERLARPTGPLRTA